MSDNGNVSTTNTSFHSRTKVVLQLNTDAVGVELMEQCTATGNRSNSSSGDLRFLI